METLIPWKQLTEVIEPFYPNPQGAGRRPIGIERMLRIQFLQHWFNLSDPAVEESLHDSRAMRNCVGIDLGREPVPDGTTICKFRHLMEEHHLGDQLFHLVNDSLKENGLQVSRGTIVDASIITAPGSTRNREKQRDPEMKATRKGNHRYFGMNSKTKLIHSVVATAANVHDSTVIEALLHGDEARVWGDSAYTGKKAVIAEAAPKARILINEKGHNRRKLTDEDRARNREKSRVRARVEHTFGVIKRQFGFTRARYKGLEKNAHHLYVSCALAKLVLAKKPLLRRRRRLRPSYA